MARFDFQPEKKFDFRPIERKFDFRPEPPTVAQVIETPELARVAEPPPAIAPEPLRMPQVATTPTERLAELPGPEFATTPEDIRPPYTAPVGTRMRIGPAPKPRGYVKPAKPEGWQYASPIEKAVYALGESKINHLLERFGKRFTNAFARVGETIISHPLSPIGMRQEEINRYKPQAWEELKAALKPGEPLGSARNEELVRARAAALAAAKRVPKFQIEPQKGIEDKVVDVGAGLAAFIAQLALLKKVLPKGTPDPVIWELQNQSTGGIPGQGAAMRLTLGGVGKIPVGSLKGKLAKVGLESGLFAGVTAATGGDAEDIIVAGLVPVALNSWHFAKQKRYITQYERNLKAKVLQKHNQRLQQGMNRATSEAYLKADIRVVDNAVAKAKQTIYRDDAFAPAREKWEAQRKKALGMIATGKPDAVKRGNAILDFLTTKPLPSRAKTIEAEIKDIKAARKLVSGERFQVPAEPIAPATKPIKVPGPPAAGPKLLRPGVIPTEPPVEGPAEKARREWREGMTIPELEEVLADLKKSKAKKKEIKNFEQYVEQRKQQEAAPPAGKKYEGKAYRAETGLVIKGETAADVVRYEQEELGNDLGVSPEKIAELEKRPEKDIVWVARDKETAARYGEPEEVTDAVVGGEIITEIPDGVLVLKPPTPTEAVTVEKSPLARANPMLFRRAQKATNAEEFIESVIKADKTTRERVSVPILTDFFNRVKGELKVTPAEAPTPGKAPTVKPEAAEELAAQRGAFQKYQKSMPDATEQEIVRFMIEDGLRPPDAVLKRNEEMPEVQEIRAQDKTEEVARMAEVKAVPEAKAEEKYVAPKGTRGIAWPAKPPGKDYWGIFDKRSSTYVGRGYKTYQEAKEAADRANLKDAEYEKAMKAPTPAEPIPEKPKFKVTRARLPITKEGVLPEVISEKRYTAEGEEIEPEAAKPGVGTVDNINVIGLADRFSERLKTAEAPVDNRQVKKWVAEELGVSESELRPEKGYSHKKVQEAMELAVVRAARGIIEENRGRPDEIFRNLQQLYERQPSLAARTGISIERQAYSTPVPLAFVASELAHITPDTIIYEPTAGTGMLTIGAAPDMAVVNELDPTRAEILRSQGYFRVSEEDARTISPKNEKSFDAVIMNPPFGKHKTVLYGKFKLSHIEHIIAAENLKAMKDEGRAVMIIAAPKKLGWYSTPEWVFGNYIYSHYNVIGDFEVAGELYRRQGAAWPVRVIAIHGRKKSEKYGPKKGIFRAKTWQEAYNKMKEILADEPEIIYPAAREKPISPESLRRRVEERPAEEVEPVRRPAAGPIEPAGERPAVKGRISERIAERGPVGRRPRGRVVRVPAGEREVQREPSRKPSPVLPERKARKEEKIPGERPERPAFRKAEREPEAERVEKRKPVGVVGPSALGKLQIPYKPSSKAPPTNENIPTYLEPHVTAALENLKQNVGDIDDYVREQLQYESNEKMWEHLSASQVDSIALALDKIDKRSAMVVGHQTGVGKGRVAASIVRREILNGRKPIFFTSGKHLFTDFFRDLFDVGLTEEQIKPLMMNAQVDIKNKENKVIVKGHKGRAEANHAIHKAIKDKDYNLVLSTYHQINTETRKQRAQLATLMPGNLIILDESHNAAGESQTGEYIKEILIPHSSGVLFSSATYAKTPKTMALYARTGLLDAFDGDTENMLTSVQTGGEPYQEVIAAALARANSYIRTELDFSGIKYETTIDARHLERDTKRADKVTSVLRDIIAFDNFFAKEIVDPIKKDTKAQAKRRKGPAVTIGHTNFAAVSHNAIKQMLLALKIDETIEQAKQALKAGQRPIIALENTMGSFLKRYVEQHGLAPGDIIKDFDYREVLLNMLRNTLSYTITHGWGDVEVIKVPLEELPLDAQDAFHRTENDIKEMELDLPGSPIDEIISRLEAEGHKVGEITGRDKRLIKRAENEYEIAARSAKERDKTSIVYDYNNGSTDVLVVNVAGAEGMSAHASRDFKNQEKRAMIVAQAAADINKFVQILGRINRKGQVVDPEYKILMTALPSEIRPAAILENKMRSLNANTSAKTKGAYQQKEIPDILNLYGDYIAAQYVIQNPDIISYMGLSGIDVVRYRDSMSKGQYHGPWNEDKLARRFTGRLAILPTEQQQEFYEWAEPTFNNLIDLLNKTDQNELVSADKDYKAELVDSKTIFVGEPGNIFQEPATLDNMGVKLEGRPMTTAEIKDEIKRVVEEANLSTPTEYKEHIIARIDNAWEQYRAARKREGEKVRQNSYNAYLSSKNILRRINLESVRVDGEGNPLVLLEIIDSFGKKKYDINPAAPSNIRIRIAIPHPARTAVISLSHFHNSPSFYGNLNKYFNIPADQKEERYIANGNIIAAMGVLVGANKANHLIKPKVINYTMADGSRRQGLLLPKNYNPDYDLPTTVNMIPEAAAAYLMDQPSGTAHLKMGEARIIKTGGPNVRKNVYIEVPKSKARGLKYFGDTGLKELVGEFESWRQTMRADFNADKLLDVLNYLKSRGNAIKSDDAAPETAREYNNAHRDRGEEIGFAEPAKEIKIPLKRGVARPADISQRQIIQFLSKSFGIPIRGIATFRKKKPGWYNQRTRSIRLKNVNSLRVGAHEVGHHIDIYFNNKASVKMSHAWYGLGAELVRLGKAVYGKKRPKEGYKMEGYAEFVFGWLTGAIDLKNEAPRMLRFFEKEYLKDNAEIADILHTARDMIDKWKEQGAEARFDSQIGQKLKPEKNRKERFSLWFQTAFTDVSAPIQRALHENIPERSIWFGSKDPGFLYQFFTQTEGARAITMVEKHTIDLWGNPTGKSLRAVLKPVAHQIKDFVRYVVAARAINLNAREIESGFDIEDAVYIFKKYDSPQWRKAAHELTEWNHRVLDYLVQAGGLEEEAAKQMRELNPIYIPFLRIFAPGEKRRTPRGVGRGLIRRGKGVYAITGSGRGIEGPIESMITQTRRLISIAHKSLIARAFAEIEQKTPGLAGLIERVPPPMKATTFNASQLKKQLIDLGIDVEPGELDDAMFTVFSNSPIFLGKEHIISVIVNGKRQWFEVSPELYRILESLDQFQLPKLLNLIVGKACRLCRLGATGIHAAFGLVRNPIRDVMDTVVKARYARGPAAFVKGVAKDLSNTGLAKALGIEPNKAAERFTDIGGQISGYLGQDRTSIQHLRGSALSNTVGEHAIETVKHPIIVLRKLFGIPESGLRIEEFDRALKDWMAKHQPQGGEPPPDAIVYAFAMASDQTINYRRAGLYGRWLNSMTAFWNANAQDPSKVYRTFTGDRAKQAALWGLAALTLPAIGIWWLNKDEEWWKELPPWEKANNIHIPIFKRVKQIPIVGRAVTKYKQGEEVDYILRLPVPFLIGHIFQSMPVTILDALYNLDPEKISDFLGEVYKADVKPLFDWPAAIGPYLDLRSNKDWAGRPIIPRSVEGKLPEDQYKHYTTEFCKAIGKIFKVSPAQIEYALNSYSGGLYRRITGAAELVTGRRERELAPKDWPIIGTLFVRDPYAPKESIERFYKEKERLNRMYQSGKIVAGSELGKKRKRYNYISTKYLSLYWKRLQEVKLISERKRIYGKIGELIKRAEKGQNKLIKVKT